MADKSQTTAHEWIRHALALPEDAPMRFDFYAQEIERLGDERDAFRQALSGIQDGYLVNHTSKWVKVVVDGVLKNGD